MASDEVSVTSADGRWQGRLTSRPLPVDDPSIAALGEADRALLASVWHARAASERVVADSFVVIGDALRALDADASLVDLAVRAVDDEMRHAELSRVVASRYAGRELDPPPRLPLRFPKHAAASPRLRHVLHVVGQCCLNETISSAFLEAAIARARAPLASAALRELLSDEVDHARLGWALLGAAGPSTRAEVAPWLPRMAIANLRMWREAPRTYPDDPRLAEHGAPPADVVEDALRMAFRDLVIPGLDELGLPTGEIRGWLERGAPT